MGNKEPACQCRRLKRCGFNPWVRKIPWRRAWKLTPVFTPGEFHGERSLAGYTVRGVSRSPLDTTEATWHVHKRNRLQVVASNISVYLKGKYILEINEN